jgi:tyrosyl-tRNA synthetase
MMQRRIYVPHRRILQKALAEDITVKTHSYDDYEFALNTSEFLFGNGSILFMDNISKDEVLIMFEGIDRSYISLSELQEGIDIATLLSEKSNFIESKGAAKKLIQTGGISINKVKMSEPNYVINSEDLVNDKFIVVQKGKKNYFLLIAE